jgi:YbbR domain-containing protein
MKIRKIFDNIEIKLICLLLAIVMWLYVNRPIGTGAIDRVVAAISRNDQGRVTFRKVPVQLMGLQEEWKADPSKISLEVKSLAAEIEMSDFQAVINLTPKDVEEGRVTLTAENVELPDGLIFMKAEPNKIKITKL